MAIRQFRMVKGHQTFRPATLLRRMRVSPMVSLQGYGFLIGHYHSFTNETEAQKII